MSGHPTPPPSRASRTGAAIAATDAESGSEGLTAADDRAKSLYALKVMHERGLLPKAEYEARVAALNTRNS